jgi:hypothetical protein
MSDYTADEIAQAISDMEAAGASPADIAQAAADAGVSVSEIAAATGSDAASIQSVFDSANITAPPDPAPAPVAPDEPAPAPEPYTPPTPDVPAPAPVAPDEPAPAPEPYTPPTPDVPAPAPSVQDNVNTWFQQNPTATPSDVLQAIQAAGGLTPEIADAVGAHYGTSASDVQAYYTTNTPAPAPVAPDEPAPTSDIPQPVFDTQTASAPDVTGPAAPTANLGQYNDQTQQGIVRAGLDTTMNTVAGGGNLSDIVSQGLTPQPVAAYKDASGTMITAAPNTFMVSNPDGSGGALNYFFTVDPKTGTTAPIANPGQNLTYSPGSPGGVISGLVSAAGDIIKTVAPIALDVALIANGIDPVTAGAITGSSSAAVNGGSVGDILKGGITGGAAGYVGGNASDLVGSNSPVLSGVAGGSAGGATAAALNGQDILKGAATGGIVGGAAGGAGLGVTAENATQLAQDTIDVNNALSQFNATNPGATATQQADFLINDPSASFDAKTISNVLGPTNPVSQVATVMDQTGVLNSQEVAATQSANTTPSGPVAPTTPTATTPAPADWAAPLADAYNTALQTHDWSAVNNIIQSNGLDTIQIMNQFPGISASTLSNIDDIVNGGVTNTTTLPNVNVTAPANTGITSPATPPVVAPVVPTSTLPTVNVTAPADTGITSPATPPVVAPVVPTPSIGPAVGPDVLPTVNVTAPADTGITSPATPPVVAPVVPTPTLPTVNVTAPADTGITSPATPPVVAPVVPTPTLPTVNVTAPADTGITSPATPPVVSPPILPPVTITAPADTGITSPATPPVVSPPILPPVTITAPKDTGITSPATPPVVSPPVLPPVTITAPKDPGLTPPAPPTPPVVVPPVVPPVTPPSTPPIPPTPPVVVPPVVPKTPTNPTPPVTPTLPPVVVTPPGKLVSPGLNPGWMNLGVKPFYNTTNPTQSQFYWGAHPYMTSISDLLANYNNVPNAPTTPWGATNSAVGGQSHLDVPAFVQQYITNPAYAGVNNATSPGYMPTLDQMSLSSLLNASKQ